QELGVYTLSTRLTRLFLDEPLSGEDLEEDPRFARGLFLSWPRGRTVLPVSRDEWAAIIEHLGSRAGGQFVPAEAAAGAADLLRRLVGQPLRTVRNKINTIMAVRPPNVVVATERSPDGQAVPIAWVDEALSRLTKTGRAEVHPSSSSYRSSFVGAVLLTLPGA